MRGSILFSLLLLMIPSAHAYDGIFKILDERYVDTTSDLPESKDLKPGMNWQSSGNIRAWVDIVGFKNTVRIGNVSYMQGNPADNAIVKYGVSIGELKSRVVTDYRVHCYWCAVGSVDKRLEVFQRGNETVARLHATLNWYEAVENSGSTETISYAESATFEDSKPVPKQYPAFSEPEVIVTQYNNSMYENVGIKIIGDNYTKVSFKYHDKQAVRTSKILHVENNSEGIVYGNVTELGQWNIEGTGISQFYNEILLDGNLSKMDINEFDIRVYDPFSSMKVNPENFTVQRVEFAPQKNMSSLMIAVVGMVSTFMVGTLYLINRMRSRWRINLF
jgi:hypothetical protein